jgi:hypothetical protein
MRESGGLDLADAPAVALPALRFDAPFARKADVSSADSFETVVIQ